MALSLPLCLRDDFIKFALIIPLGGSLLAETTGAVAWEQSGDALFLLSRAPTAMISARALYTHQPDRIKSLQTSEKREMLE